jgi:hypothetical protein
MRNSQHSSHVIELVSRLAILFYLTLVLAAPSIYAVDEY